MRSEIYTVISVSLTTTMVRELRAAFEHASLVQGKHTVIPQPLIDLAYLILDALDALESNEK